ncbi:aldose 1-epimerase [Caulobacter henricii]|uniref:Aldose epimerase n=1 Tax=Caulobacter henricii TaxID=69395 RepID=A0A0P0NW52_9CAUL|nr:aldose 1-epimerase [Caulobacter henricii]ALL12231.1 aldose epimerase [Caulobacter henricii]
MIAVEKGAARLELLPDTAGAVRRFSVAGRDILLVAPEGANDALQTAHFPLVPFCNRIPKGRFTFDGREVVLPPNLGDHPHALHGQGWRGAWTVDPAAAGQAVLSYDHTPGDWPWAYRAEQRFVLGEASLRITLSVTNKGDQPMPAGLGFHPYFPLRPGERLKAAVDGVWLIDPDVLPTVHHQGAWGPDWVSGAGVAGHPDLIDHCYTGWDQRAELSAPGLPTTTITASADCRWLHVYVPPGQDFYCVEPCASRPNPFGKGETGMVTLAPGQTRSVRMEIATGSD